MADKPYNFPDAELLSRAQEYKSIQEEIADKWSIIAESGLKIVDVNKNIEKGVVRRLARQKEILLELQKERAALIKAEQSLSSVTGADEKKVKVAIASGRQRISGLQAELKLLDLVNKQALVPWLYLLTKIWGVFSSFDQAAQEFRMEMGMTRDNAKELRKLSQELATDFAHVGVNIQGAYDSFRALGKEMGSVHLVSMQLAKTTALMKAQLGISEESTAGFLRNMAAISKSSMESQESMAYIAQDMASAVGVPLAEIMGDVAKMSREAYTMISRTPTQIIRTSVEARRLNTTMNDMARASRDILNFSDSINAEMEASVLLGRSINLQRARELAYRRDLVGSTKEILRITRQIDFENLDVFQQEAFAKATGRSVEELLKMSQAERQLEAARRSLDPRLRAQAAELDKILRLNEQQLKLRAKDVSLSIQQQANQARMVAISQKWNQLLTRVAYVFLPAIDNLLGFVADNLEAIVVGTTLLTTIWKSIGSVITKALSAPFSKAIFYFQEIETYSIKMTNIFQKIGYAVGKVAYSISQWSFKGQLASMGKFGAGVMSVASRIGKFFGTIGSTIGKLFAPLTKLFGWFGKVGGIAARFAGIAGFFGKWVPVVGWVITAFQAIYHVIKNTVEYVKNWSSMSWGERIVQGLLIVPKAIYNTILKPFVDAFIWIKNWFMGKSPSKIGMGIVKGLVSVGGMIFDALTAPWRKGLAWIADKIPGMGKVAEKLRGGITDVINKPVETKITTTYVPAVTVTPTATRVAGTTPTAAPTATKDEEGTFATDKTLQDILSAINSLNANLSSGKIGIYLDGQLVSATLARQTEFRGGYGVNRY